MERFGKKCARGLHQRVTSLLVSVSHGVGLDCMSQRSRKLTPAHVDHPSSLGGVQIARATRSTYLEVAVQYAVYNSSVGGGGLSKFRNSRENERPFFCYTFGAARRRRERRRQHYTTVGCHDEVFRFTRIIAVGLPVAVDFPRCTCLRSGVSRGD